MNIQVIEALIKDLSTAKTGWKTSEFWVALVPIVAAMLHVVGVTISTNATDNLIIICFGFVSAVYITARTWLKKARLDHALSLAGLVHTLEADIKKVI